MLAHPCHSWQTLDTLWEKIQEAAPLPTTTTPAGSEGNLIGHMQMKDVLRILLHYGGCIFYTSNHVIYIVSTPSFPEACGCSLNWNIHPRPISSSSPPFLFISPKQLSPNPPTAFDNNRLQAQECRGMQGLKHVPDSTHDRIKRAGEPTASPLSYFWSSSVTVMVAPSGIMLPQADNENNQAETWEFWLFSSKKEKKVHSAEGPNAHWRSHTWESMCRSGWIRW